MGFFLTYNSETLCIDEYIKHDEKDLELYKEALVLQSTAYDNYNLNNASKCYCSKKNKT